MAKKAVMKRFKSKFKIPRSQVVDATKSLVITVNEQDVRASSKRDPFNCAVAVAAKRCYKANQVAVFKSRTYVQMKPEGQWIKYMTPNSARTELVSFDRGGGFQQDEYTLRPPSETAQLGYRWNPSKTRRGSGKNHRSPAHVVQGVRARAPSRGG